MNDSLDLLKRAGVGFPSDEILEDIMRVYNDFLHQGFSENDASELTEQWIKEYL